MVGQSGKHNFPPSEKKKIEFPSVAAHCCKLSVVDNGLALSRHNSNLAICNDNTGTRDHGSEPVCLLQFFFP